MQHPGSFKTMGSTAVVCEENIIRETEKKERKREKYCEQQIYNDACTIYYTTNLRE